MTKKKLGDTFVYRVIRNRRINKEAYSVFLRLNTNVKEERVSVSPHLKEVLEKTLKYDRQEGLIF